MFLYTMAFIYREWQAWTKGMPFALELSRQNKCTLRQWPDAVSWLDCKNTHAELRKEKERGRETNRRRETFSLRQAHFSENNQRKRKSLQHNFIFSILIVSFQHSMKSLFKMTWKKAIKIRHTPFTCTKTSQWCHLCEKWATRSAMFFLFDCFILNNG